MSDKKFAILTFSLFAVLTSFVVVFNVWIDPMWHYGHAHTFNDVQQVIDEREQKIVRLRDGIQNEDTLLIGSSRSTYIHPSAFEMLDVFNFSVANLSMRAYDSMIRYGVQVHPEFERVLLGVDFFKASEQEAGLPSSIMNYEKKIEGSFYKSKNALSLKVFDYAVGNFRLSWKDSITQDRLYNRQLEAFARELDDETRAEELSLKIERFKEEFYGENFVFYEAYSEILNKVINNFKEQQFTFFTTPISTQLFAVLVEEGNYPDYERWIRELVDVNGEVVNFMYPNEYTNNSLNYLDGHHFYPHVGDAIAKQLEAVIRGEELDGSFGVRVTRENVDEHLRDVRQTIDDWMAEQ